MEFRQRIMSAGIPRLNQMENTHCQRKCNEWQRKTLDEVKMSNGAALFHWFRRNGPECLLFLFFSYYIWLCFMTIMYAFNKDTLPYQA